MRGRLPWISLALCIPLLSSCEGALAERPRHLILVTIDTLRADHLSCYGYPRGTTAAATAAERGSAPGFTIDELSAQGTLFTRAYAPRGETFPSIATLLTGRPPLETCAIDNPDTLPSSARTLAEILKDAGFETAAFTSNRLLVPGSGIEQGFDHFETDGSPEHDERMVEAAQEWIASHERDGGPPLFVWVHLVGPHLAYQPQPLRGVDFARLYARADYGGPADGSRALLDKVHGEGPDLDPADVEHLVALYDGEIGRIDHLVSRFLSFCAGEDPRRPRDLLESSLLVFTADHGEELHERHRYFGHSKSVYGSVLHVPLVLRHPRSLAAGARLEDVVGLEDLAPTVLELFRLDPETAMHGRSLVHVLRGGLADPRPAFSLWNDSIFSVRSERWRLVWNPDRIEPTDRPPGRYTISEVALFDAAADPGERIDVSGTHPGVVAELQRAIRAWLEGLDRCVRPGVAPGPERLEALRQLGYAGDDR